MKRLFYILAVSLCSITAAQAGIDEAINAATAPIATLIGQIVFFKMLI